MEKMKFRFLVFLNFYVLSTFCKSVWHNIKNNKDSNTSGKIYSIKSIPQPPYSNESTTYTEKTNVGLTILSHVGVKKYSKVDKEVKDFEDKLNDMKNNNEKIIEKRKAKRLENEIYKTFFKKTTE